MVAWVRYRGYDIVPQAESIGWSAWILLHDVPEGRVSADGSAAAVVTVAKEQIDQKEVSDCRKQNRR